MSLNIYYGLKATSSDPFEIEKQVRNVLEPLFFEKFVNAYGRAKEVKGKSTWEEVFHAGSEELIEGVVIDLEIYDLISDLHKSLKHSFSELDFGYTVYLHRNAAGGNPLALIYGEKSREYIKLLTDANVFELYGYWEGPDPEEGLSEVEWDERKKAWSEFGDINRGDSGLEINFPSSLESCVKLYN